MFPVVAHPSTENGNDEAVIKCDGGTSTMLPARLVFVSSETVYEKLSHLPRGSLSGMGLKYKTLLSLEVIFTGTEVILAPFFGSYPY